ncbi:MAG: hypothetical protein ACI4V1_00465 [Eubacteriales bacterium]
MTILIAVAGCDTEAFALRAALESFGASVLIQYLGRPDDFLNLLRGHVPFTPDVLLFCGHGEDGEFLMPELAPELYRDGEPHRISARDVRANLRLSPALCISTACTTGTLAMAAAFTEHGTAYLAPRDYIEGSAALFFVIHLFYLHLAHAMPLSEAASAAKRTDTETGWMVWYGEESDR